jgi:hypothetical protein
VPPPSEPIRFKGIFSREVAEQVLARFRRPPHLMMKYATPLLILALLHLPLAGRAADDEGFTPLFNGTTLDGWHSVGGNGSFRVEDNCIVGYGDNVDHNTFLRTDRTYRNFDLRFEFRLTAGNSGMMFRAQQRPGPNGRVFGYQCEHDNNPKRAWTAGLYDEARRMWLQPHSTDPRGQQAFTKQGQELTRWDDWNEVRILCVDKDIKIWLNGELRVHFVDTDPEHFTPEGFFGLQVHSGATNLVRWRALRIRELP